MIELDDFASTVGLVTGPLRARLEGRGYRVAAVMNEASEHVLHVFVENEALGFCVTWDWHEARCVAYPAPHRAEWWRWAIDAGGAARWRGQPRPQAEASPDAIAGLLDRVGELEALARNPDRWRDVCRGRLPA
ncbi:hypothetical protein [Demequina mangrovi]|uniref:Uncharacterized protein n=1 Tax=Demequina mangrovi TaxID=1043493 RepID=A0A1H6WS92_9MICO|nr:hypothetical protein [Demequina mangrovi]SEJ19698.1 hypothetical protein SAMN05421637_1117 [Demequina mangrovi]